MHIGTNLMQDPPNVSRPGWRVPWEGLLEVGLIRITLFWVLKDLPLRLKRGGWVGNLLLNLELHQIRFTARKGKFMQDVNQVQPLVKLITCKEELNWLRHNSFFQPPINQLTFKYLKAIYN